MYMTLSTLPDVGRMPNSKLRPQKLEVEVTIDRKELASGDTISMALAYTSATIG
mgnify:CR=1 FL=1